MSFGFSASFSIAARFRCAPLRHVKPSPQNFDEMSSSKFERLRREIQEFASIRWSAYETAGNPVSREAARQLALMVDDGLGAYARGITWDLPQMSIARSVIPNGDQPLYNGRWNDTFLMSAADVLQTVGKLLRGCAAEGSVRWTRSSRQRSVDRKVRNPAQVNISLC
jgi:hypothetical protein